MFEFIGKIIGYIAGVSFCLFVLFVVVSMSINLIRMVIFGCVESIKSIGEMSIGKLSKDKTPKDEKLSIDELVNYKYNPAEIDYVSPSSSSDSFDFGCCSSNSDDISKMKAEISRAVRDGIAMSDLEHGRSVGNYGTSDDLFLK